MSKSSKGTAKIVITEILFGLALLILSLLTLTVFWVIDTWKSISFGEIVLQLSSPIEGTSSDIINMFYTRCLLPAVLIVAAFTVLGIILRQRKIKVVLLHIISLVLATVMLAVSVVCFDRQFGALDYYKNINAVSDFIETNYVDPSTVELSFPGTKRNLIYIYLESMEITYADKESGGYLERNCIPELTELAKRGDCFSGFSAELNGAKTLFGTQYTMGGMLAQSAGLPMFGNLGNTAEFQDEFYPGATALGDILAANGYKQELMVGSDAVFGGRAKFFEQHGGYEIFDLFTARERGLIPEDYSVWWGFEDEKLFEFAKAEILDLAAGDEPFNFTMLTADTHFPGGYVCDKCEFGYNTQYENVLACSSKQVYEFVEWIKDQDFYENTAIVICGDHLTMDSEFCKSISDDYDRRTYVTVINSAVSDASLSARTYSTLDMFPTTLAAMGCELGSDRLGLGTNLYSKTPTLIEDNDISYVNRELAKESPYVDENIASWDKYNAQILVYDCYLNVEIRQLYDEDELLLVSVSGIELLDDTDKDIFATLYSPEGVELDKKQMNRGKDLLFDAGFDPDLLGILGYGTVVVEIEDEFGEYHVVASREVFWSPYVADESVKYDIDKYIELLSGLDDVTIFIATSDDAATRLSASTSNKLKKLLSLNADIYFRGSYCAVIDDGQVVFDQGSPNEVVSNSGTLSNGSEYTIVSAGFNSGSMCSVVIDGVEYAPNTRGINFVIFDNENGEVIEYCAFDTYATNCVLDSYDYDELQDIDFDYSKSDNNLDVSVTIDSEQGFTNAVLFVWDKDLRDEPLKIDMEDVVKGGGRICSATVDITGLDPDSLYCSIYIKNDAVIARYRAKVFE